MNTFAIQQAVVAEMRERDAEVRALREFHAAQATTIGELYLDRARLRALVKEVEWRGGEHGDCPWCDGDQHFHECPAFTPDGTVK